MYCHKCGNWIGSDGYGSCVSCGYSGRTTALSHLLEMQNPEVCRNCGTQNPGHANYCQTCSNRLKKHTRCPHCGSTNFSGQKTGDFNWKKAIKGSLLGGIVAGPLAPIGLLA